VRGTPAYPVAANDSLASYWACSGEELADRLHAGAAGLSSAEAAARLRHYGPNSLDAQRPLSRVQVLQNQLRSPLLLLLIFAAAASIITGEWFDAGIVLVIVFGSAAIGYSREYGAQAAAEALRARIRTRTRVLRDESVTEIDTRLVVPGDVVVLAAGSLVPADAYILESTDCFVSEAVLTGESFPVEKHTGVIARQAGLAARTNCVFLGTNVRSGTARCLVVRTGAATEFGAIAGRLMLQPPETEFDRGIRRFGYLLTTAMLVLIVVVFTIHVLQDRPSIETLLFAIALAVGLSPELLPAILSISLARGARSMGESGVLVRRLNAIENLGSMDVLCTDKTGTLTEGAIRVEGAYTPDGQPSRSVLELAAINAVLETGLDNPLDQAIVAARQPELSRTTKLGEIPFDFVRKRVAVTVRHDAGIRVIVKGAYRQVLEICTRTADGRALEGETRQLITSLYERWSSQGIRVLAVATKDVAQSSGSSRHDEQDMAFAGFVTFLDPPKPGVAEAIQELSRLGVSIKLITGDNELVARRVAALVGLPTTRVLTGQQLDELHDEALWHAAERTDIFAEVDPNQKERIILALKKQGHVVGFLGDGVNDAPAMHAADTSLSVDDAVDVARDAADFVLLERGLAVIRRGIEEGRRTFANTLKYVLITTSANLGNMVSMAAASLFLPFLPLLAGQILLNNFLSDIPAIGLADDRVDDELVDRPRRWDIGFIGRFMLVFGLVSSAFDLVTFAVLRRGFDAPPELFRTGWFVESLLTELVVALVVRTRRPFFRSRPGSILLWSTVLLVVVATTIPFFPYASRIGFVPLSGALLTSLAVITVGYVAATELVKRLFYRPAHEQRSQRRENTSVAS
jgi:P-type Mg2+ transporter